MEGKSIKTICLSILKILMKSQIKELEKNDIISLKRDTSLRYLNSDMS